MKKILLRVTRVRPEMRYGEMVQAFRLHATTWKIEFTQRAFNPDIHRKSPVKPVGKQQNTIGDFTAHAAQFHQFRARFGQWQMTWPVQIEFAVGDLTRGGEQMRRAKTHLAGAKFGFTDGGKPFSCWKGMEQKMFI